MVVHESAERFAVLVSVTVAIREGGVPASEAPGAFVDGSTAESKKTDRLC